MQIASISKISSENLEGVLDLLEDAVVCTGPQNEILWMNRRARILLKDPETFDQANGWESFVVSGCRSDYLKQLNQCNHQSLSEKPEPVFFECLAVNRHGKVFPARVQINKLNNHSSCLTVHLIRELNPQQSLPNRSLQVPEYPLAREALQDFAYILSHQSNDPLRKILSFIERLDHGYRRQLDARGQKYLGSMGKAVKKFQVLVNDLRVFSRISSRPGSIEIVHLSDVLHEVISEYQKALARSKGTVIVGKLPPVMANPVQMRIMFKQLLSNSLKFARKNHPPKISVKCTVGKSDFIEITVQDNGIGFNNQYAERIFAPCERLHGNAEYPGSGMGLAICRKITDRHFGVISGNGNPGKGAAFTLRLPAAFLLEDQNKIS